MLWWILNKIELERYTRHILLKEIGGSGQNLLKKSSITMVGAGGLGSIILYYLAESNIIQKYWLRKKKGYSSKKKFVKLKSSNKNWNFWWKI